MRNPAFTPWAVPAGTLLLFGRSFRTPASSKELRGHLDCVDNTAMDQLHIPVIGLLLLVAIRLPYDGLHAAFEGH